MIIEDRHESISRFGLNLDHDRQRLLHPRILDSRGGGGGAQEGYPAKHQPEGHQASSGSDRVVIAATACGHRGNCPPDCGQAAFANGRVALGSFAVCCGWVIASRRFLARWVGWLAIASGAGLALSRIS
jgi:hypothetical protein